VKRFDPVVTTREPGVGPFQRYRPFTPATWRRMLTGKG